MTLHRINVLTGMIACSVAWHAQAADTTFNLTADGGGIKVSNADKTINFQVGGRLQYDFDATRSDDNGVDTQDFDVRRARLDVKGNAGDWGYKIQFNVAESDGSQGGSAEDLYVQYSGFGKASVLTIGKQQEAFGLERVESDNDTASLERSAVTELLTPVRSAGVSVSGSGARWSYSGGIYEGQGDGRDDFARLAFTGRATWSPYLAGTTVFHLGASYMNRPGSAALADLVVYGLEGAYSQGPFHVQAEYLSGERGEQDLDGGYLEAGWTLTGEARPYAGGAFGRVAPAGRVGAWEVVARYEAGDGNYTDVGLTPVQIYDGRQYTAGLNWYATRNARFGLSYMHGEAKDITGHRFEGSEVRTRFQYVF